MPPAKPSPAVHRPEPTPAERTQRRRAFRAGAVGVVVLLVGLLAWVAVTTLDAPTPLTQADVDAAVAQQLKAAREQELAVPPDAALAYRTIGPSLVTVTAQEPGGGQGLGSGVIVKADGTVLTALHVVAGAVGVEVTFADGTTGTAKVALARPEQDIAVLSVDRLPAVVVPAVLAGPPAVGDAVFAVGNPLGLRRSLSAGVVSATDRSIAPVKGTTLSGLIQFDAAVNPGNSGGPLLDRAGQVVGIVTGLANPADQDFFVGIGFAVPIGSAAGGSDGPLK